MTPDELFYSNLHRAKLAAKRMMRDSHPSVDYDSMYAAALVGLWKASRRYDGRVKFTTYAFHRMRGEMLEHARFLCNARRKAKTVCLGDWQKAAKPPIPVAELAEELWLGMTTKQKQVAELRYVQGMDFADIGTKLGIQSSSAWYILKRAMPILQANYTRLYGHAPPKLSGRIYVSARVSSHI